MNEEDGGSKKNIISLCWTRIVATATAYNIRFSYPKNRIIIFTPNKASVGASSKAFE